MATETFAVTDGRLQITVPQDAPPMPPPIIHKFTLSDCAAQIDNQKKRMVERAAARVAEAKADNAALAQLVAWRDKAIAMGVKV